MKTNQRSSISGWMAAIALATAPLAASANDVAKIGFSGPLSGGAALYGKNVLDGMQMAVDEINSQGLVVGGKNVKLEIVSLDDKYNPSETAINAQRLVQEHKVGAVLVPHSGGTYAVQTTNERQNLLVLSYTSVPQVTSRGNKLTLRIPPEYTGYINPFVQYAMSKWGKNVAFAAADHDYAKLWASAFKPAWEAAGGKVVAENPMSYNRAADFYSGISKVLAAKPDVLFVGGPSEPTGLVVKQARELGFKGGFIFLDQAKPEEIAKVTGGYAALEGSIGAMPVIDDQRPATKAFIDRYRKSFPSRDPSYEVTLPYIAIHALAQAMKLAGSTSDGAAIRAQLDKSYKALPQAINFHGYKGVDANGGATFDIPIGVIEGGKVKDVSAPVASK